MVPFLLLFPFLLGLVRGHGYLAEPPARNAMWRYGFLNPVNYNDNELYCGGFSVQWSQNGGKCGVCGDSFALEQPRTHEAGGKYGNGIIAQRYTMGQTIDIEIDISANHWGYFELKLCPTDKKTDIATQECFDKYPLALASDPTSHRFYVPLDSPKITKFNYQVELPYGLTCSHCVMQWTYYTGNTWGVCNNGTEGMGCGTQEWFRNCADISIQSVVASFPPNAFPLARRTIYSIDQRTGQTNPVKVTAHVCEATEKYSTIPGMDDWCQKSCLSYPPVCPAEKCQCLSHCEAIGRLANQEGTDVYCHRKCLHYPPTCPKSECKCHYLTSPTEASYIIEA